MAVRPDPAFWRGKRVLLTGHTGFKGGWAALWLSRMGAEVTGFALAPDTQPNLFSLAGVASGTVSRLGDLRDEAAAQAAVATSRPQLVLHMAAQPIVRRSIADPVETFATNVLGTAHLLAALRGSPGLSTILVVTSDKVYANDAGHEALSENDRLGGTDPYSASKAATELVAASFAGTYFTREGVRLATARGGNVVGGGDFAADRLVPDAVRAVSAGTPLVLRHPGATRPWQHVLDCVSGYLVYAEGLTRGVDVPAALNFGPSAGAPVPVGTLADAVLEALGSGSGWRHEPDPGSVEKATLAVDASRARASLGWDDLLRDRALVAWTAAWYRAWREGHDMRAVSLDQIGAYEALAGHPSP
jgi:CDP-glucose 4,6-dehydratase